MHLNATYLLENGGDPSSNLGGGVLHIALQYVFILLRFELGEFDIASIRKN